MSSGTRPVHLSMIRSFQLADFLTLANAACGVLAVFAVLGYVEARAPRRLLLATALIPLALIFDVLDGRVARSRQKHSAMGRELDSLADIISFGVAPAAIAYGAGMRGLWDVVILVYFVCCGVSRLARFNVTAASLSDSATGKVKYFEGTPIPTSILIVALMAVALAVDRTGDRLWFGAVRIAGAWLHPLALVYVASGSAMISATLRIPKP